MTLMHGFEQSFLGRATKRGGLTLLRASDAVALIDAARAHASPVLGVETFVVTAAAIHPQMDHILDLSGADKKCDSWAEAQHFISDRSAGDYWFEVSL